ncbi:hypothetical protein [Streptomyces sp. NPDC012466]|jgi:hypothetical protein|uniref:hypothetical protein n=1 Tax=Streptomyces sp. NPDC012466 TaxID=3364835 RepID=UPI0036E80427
MLGTDADALRPARTALKDLPPLPQRVPFPGEHHAPGALGYEAVAGIAKETLSTGRGFAELSLEKVLLLARAFAELLRPEVVGGPGQSLV